MLKNAAIAGIRAIEGILRNWDPINIEPCTIGPVDEYDSYATHIVSMVKGGCTIEELAAHLEHLCVEKMALGKSSAESRARSLKFAAQMANTLRLTTRGDAGGTT